MTKQIVYITNRNHLVAKRRVFSLERCNSLHQQHLSCTLLYRWRLNVDASLRVFFQERIVIRVDFPPPGIQSFGFEFRNPF